MRRGAWPRWWRRWWGEGGLSHDTTRRLTFLAVNEDPEPGIQRRGDTLMATLDDVYRKYGEVSEAAQLLET